MSTRRSVEWKPAKWLLLVIGCLCIVFLFQAMGVYLYGELMVNEDAKQQELARKCYAAAQEHMDASSAKVVAEMLFWRGDFFFLN